jgi:hypothetical protein
MVVSIFHVSSKRAISEPLYLGEVAALSIDDDILGRKYAVEVITNSSKRLLGVFDRGEAFSLLITELGTHIVSITPDIKTGKSATLQRMTSELPFRVKTHLGFSIKDVLLEVLLEDLAGAVHNITVEFATSTGKYRILEDNVSVHGSEDHRAISNGILFPQITENETLGALTISYSTHWATHGRLQVPEILNLKWPSDIQTDCLYVAPDTYQLIIMNRGSTEITELEVKMSEGRAWNFVERITPFSHIALDLSANHFVREASIVSYVEGDSVKSMLL